MFFLFNICSSSNRKKSKQEKDETLLSCAILYPAKRLVIIKLPLLFIKQLPLSQANIIHSLERAEHGSYFLSVLFSLMQWTKENDYNKGFNILCKFNISTQELT